MNLIHKIRNKVAPISQGAEDANASYKMKNGL